MKTDIEIANSITMKPIGEIAQSLGINENDLELFGKYKAKVTATGEKKGKLILVTAINPTKAGEGKTTVSIGLADGIQRLYSAQGMGSEQSSSIKSVKSVSLALREPSLGPVFGMKGGATGGGYSQVVPMEEINLHFTGDMHAITCANNLLSAMIDNHLQWGNALGIKSVEWRRCLDMNDRALRNIVVGLGGQTSGIPREDGFDITAASEIMAILCLAQDVDDLKEKLGNITIGYNNSGARVTAADLKANEAMTILLKEAIKPNLVQTLEGVPAFLHGGPFANIAHGCNSIVATKMALSYSDYVVTEAGFGADLGAEKFLDIKCRLGQLNPSVVVIVATIRALKSSGGKPDKLSELDDAALKKGMANLTKHISNITNVFKLPCVVALNNFVSDKQSELDFVTSECEKLNVPVVTCTAWGDGGKGAIRLAEVVTKLADESTAQLQFSYELSTPIADKIACIVKKVYGGERVAFSDKARKMMTKITELGFGDLPICIAKTQYSLSDNPELLGAPSGFTVTIRDIKLRTGAGFIVAYSGDILLMPGLPKVPNAENMTINDNIIVGLF